MPGHRCRAASAAERGDAATHARSAIEAAKGDGLDGGSWTHSSPGSRTSAVSGGRRSTTVCATPSEGASCPSSTWRSLRRASSTIAEELAAPARSASARLVVEKPFGTDLVSARELNRRLTALVPEERLYRIDHFLGKEPVQDIMYLRFSNALFEPVWNREHVDSIQVTMAEDFGVEGRGAFYDRVGALRDVVQNHLLQVLALVAMEPPAGDDDAVSRTAGRLSRDAVGRPGARRPRSVPGLPRRSRASSPSPTPRRSSRSGSDRELALGGCPDPRPCRQGAPDDGDGDRRPAAARARAAVRHAPPRLPRATTTSSSASAATRA